MAPERQRPGVGLTAFLFCGGGRCDEEHSDSVRRNARSGASVQIRLAQCHRSVPVLSVHPPLPPLQRPSLPPLCPPLRFVRRLSQSPDSVGVHATSYGVVWFRAFTCCAVQASTSASWVPSIIPMSNSSRRRRRSAARRPRPRAQSPPGGLERTHKLRHVDPSAISHQAQPTVDGSRQD